MAFALVGSGVKAGDSVGGGGPVTTGTYDTTGASLIVAIQTGWNAYALPTLSDSKSNTWTYLTSKTSGEIITRIAYAENPTTGSGHTFTNTGGFYTSLCVLAFSGSAVAAVFDVQNGALASAATSRTTGSITPSADNELIISGGALASLGTGYSVDSSLTLQLTQAYDSVGASFGSIIAYKIQGALASINPTWSWSNADSTAFVIAAFKPTNPPGTTYYVSTTGNDANPGTIGSPFLTPAKGVSVLVAGDNCYIRGGTYTGSGCLIDSALTTVPGGTDWTSGLITISGYPGETAILQPGDVSECIALRTSSQKYLHFSDLVLDVQNQTGIRNGTAAMFIDTPANHIRCTRLTLKDGSNLGFHIWGAFNEFLGCTIHDIGVYDGDPATTGYPFYLVGADNLIEGCEMYDSPGYAVHGNCYFGECARNVVRWNYIHNMGHAGWTTYGVLFRGGADNIAYGNLIVNNQDGGMLAYTDSTNTQFIGNTLYGNGGAAIKFEFYGSAPTAKNNICYNNGNTIVDANSGTGTPTVDHNLTTDPTFVNAAGGDFHLQSTSAAINAGVAVTGVTLDYDGVTRGNPPDQGAYEYVSASPAGRLVFRRH